jgi:polar amino acid transport system permease protein
VPGGYEFQFAQVLPFLGRLLGAMCITALVAAGSFLLSTGLGLIAAQMRLSSHRLVRFPATAYVDLFRTTPFIVQLVWLFYGLPLIFGLQIDTFWTAVLALGLYYGAIMGEIFRAAITSLARGQREAGLALGMTPFQVSERVIYPQAVRRILPPLGSTVVSLFKDTSITSVIGVPELMNAAQNVQLQLFRPLEVFTVAAFLYLIATYPIAWFAEWLHRRYGAQASA